jgi:hypothetical protein
MADLARASADEASAEDAYAHKMEEEEEELAPTGGGGSDDSDDDIRCIPVATITAASESPRHGSRGPLRPVLAPVVEAAPAATAAASATTSARHWTCAHCTFAENERYTYLCQVCGRSRRARPVGGGGMAAAAGTMVRGGARGGSGHVAGGGLAQSSFRPNLEDKVHIREVLKIKGRFNASNIARVDKLAQEYGAFRGARGDGNCYYRSVLVSALSTILASWPGTGTASVGDGRELLEHLQNNIQTAELDILACAPDDLRGYEDARRVTLKFMDDLASIADGNRPATASDAATADSDRSTDGDAESKLPPSHRAIAHLVRNIQGDHALDRAVIQTLRGLTSAYIRKFAADADRGPCGLTYQDYIPSMEALSNGQPLAGFCRDVVEELGTDAQDILLQVVAEALGISVRIEFFFVDQEQTFYARGLNTDCPPLATVLLHPGHFDIIYRWEYCTWLCGQCDYAINRATRHPGKMDKCVKCDTVHPDAPRFAVGDRVVAVPDERYPRNTRVGTVQQFPGQARNDVGGGPTSAGEGKEGNQLAWPTLYGEYLVQFDPQSGGSYFSRSKRSDPVKVRQDLIWREGEGPKHMASNAPAQSSPGRSAAAPGGPTIPVARVVGSASSASDGASKQAVEKDALDDNEVEVGDRVKCFYVKPGRWYSGTCTKRGVFANMSRKPYIEVTFDDEDSDKVLVDKVFRYANPLPQDGLLFTEGDDVVVTMHDRSTRPGSITGIVRMNLGNGGSLRGAKKSTGVYSVRIFEPGSQMLVYEDVAEVEEKYMRRAQDSQWSTAGARGQSARAPIAGRVQGRQRGWNNTRLW